MIKNLNIADPYNGAYLTDQIELMPVEMQYGAIRTGKYGIRFTTKSAAETVFGVETKDHAINLIPNKPRGGESSYQATDKGKLRFFESFHYPYDEYIRPDDIQNILKLQQTYRQKALLEVITEKMQKIRLAHDSTKEYAMLTAMQGKLLGNDSTGNEVVLYDWYQELGFTKTTVDMELASSTTVIRSKTDEIHFHFEDNARGAIMQGMPVGLLGRTLWDDFTNHPNVYDIFKQSQANTDRLASDKRQGFMFGGIEWHPFYENFPDINGVSRQGLAADKGIVIPRVNNMLRMIYAPADRVNEAGKPGGEIYIKRINDPDDKFIKMATEANFCAFNSRPDLVVHLT